MARKRQTGTVQRTVRLSREMENWVKELAEREHRTVSNMIDVLLHRQHKTYLKGTEHAN